MKELSQTKRRYQCMEENCSYELTGKATLLDGTYCPRCNGPIFPVEPELWQSPKNEMVREQSWQAFKESGLLWWMNMVLHTFGWAIVFDYEEKELKRVYPARVRFRGFSEDSNTDGYRKVSRYLLHNADELRQEAEQ